MSASQTDGSDLVLWSADEDALVVSYAYPDDRDYGGNFCDEAELTDIYANGPAVPASAPNTIACGGDPASDIVTRTNDTVYSDSAMALVVKKTVPANGSVTFRVSYSFSSAAFENAVTPANLVDLT